MRVINQPEPKKLWSTTATCIGHRGVRLGCGATIELTEDDLFRVDRETKVHGNITSAHAEMECPICHVWSDVEGYPQPDVLPDYGAWLFTNGRESQGYELTGYYAAPMPPVCRDVPENLDPLSTNHRWFMTAGNTQ